MSHSDDEDELPKELTLSIYTDSKTSALDELNELFAKGFTVPEHLRINSVYGKSASDLDRRGKPSPSFWATAHAYFLAKRIRNLLKVI